jgi:hypothetical protein
VQDAHALAELLKPTFFVLLQPQECAAVGLFIRVVAHFAYRTEMRAHNLGLFFGRVVLLFGGCQFVSGSVEVLEGTDS